MTYVYRHTVAQSLVTGLLPLFKEYPTLPEKRGVFESLTDPEFRAVARKAQGFTDAETAKEIGVAVSTVASYMKLGRKRMNVETTQGVIWQYYLEYAPNLLYPSDRSYAASE